MPKGRVFEDLSGRVVKGWEIKNRDYGMSKNLLVYFLCECKTCGKTKKFDSQRLKNQTIKACDHGALKTREYASNTSANLDNHLKKVRGEALTEQIQKSVVKHGVRLIKNQQDLGLIEARKFLAESIARGYHR